MTKVKKFSPSADLMRVVGRTDDGELILHISPEHEEIVLYQLAGQL